MDNNGNGNDSMLIYYILNTFGGMYMHLFEVDRECTYKSVDYKVISVLDNDLLLVVPKEDLANEKFPLQTYVIPEQIE